MPSQKITIYFTPDVKQIGRIPLKDIKYETTKGDLQDRGKYEISLKNPDLIEGNCNSVKFSIKSTATLTFKSICFGEKAKHVFKVNDYFEIWDTADKSDSWCYFRGVVRQTTSTYQGKERRYTLIIDNAAGWMLGDNSIYYLRQLIITLNKNPLKFFDPIKSRYGWLDPDGSNSVKFNAIGVEKIKKPSDLLEALINKIANERVKLLSKDFYGDVQLIGVVRPSQAIKPMEYTTGLEVEKNVVFIADKLSQMEGSILDVLKMFEGRPFSEMFIVENNYKSKIIWRNSRWRDKDDNLCMENFAGDADNLVTIYTDPKIKFSEGSQGVSVIGGQKYQRYTGKENYIGERKYAGILSETISKTNEDVINAIFIYPAGMSAKTNVPSMVINQIRYDQEGAKNILDLDSVIRYGYRPATINLPFVPGYIIPKDYSNSSSVLREGYNQGHYDLIGKYLSEYTRYAASMYRNISDSGNGSIVLQNNLHVTVADDFRIVRENRDISGDVDKKENLYVNVNKITWYFDPSAPRTAIEWDRGFEKERILDQDFTYV